MTTKIKPSLKTLYEQDYHQWVEATVKHLQAKNYEAVDWGNLIEEVADLSRRQRDKLRSLLTRLWEHLLKLNYWTSEREYNAAHWKREILNFRLQIKRLLQDSPSLQPFFGEIFEECYENARKLVKERTQLPLSTFPVEPIATEVEVLDENWLPTENQ
jgi:DNA repair ATPase RecN